MIFQYACPIKDITVDKCYKMFDQLPVDRKNKVGRYRKEQDRKRCIVGVVLLRYCLMKDFDIDEHIELSYGEYGKPSLAGHPKIHFSISHSGEWVIVSVGNTVHGIDVEHSHDQTSDMFDCIFTEHERNIAVKLEDKAADDYFVRLWTVKEAYAKLLGLGLNKNFTEIDVADKEDKIVIYDRSVLVEDCIVSQQKIEENYWYTICAEDSKDNIGELETVSFEDIYEYYIALQ